MPPSEAPPAEALADRRPHQSAFVSSDSAVKKRRSSGSGAAGWVYGGVWRSFGVRRIAASTSVMSFMNPALTCHVSKDVERVRSCLGRSPSSRVIQWSWVVMGLSPVFCHTEDDLQELQTAQQSADRSDRLDFQGNDLFA